MDRQFGTDAADGTARDQGLDRIDNFDDIRHLSRQANGVCSGEGLCHRCLERGSHIVNKNQVRPTAEADCIGLAIYRSPAGKGRSRGQSRFPPRTVHDQRPKPDAGDFVVQPSARATPSQASLKAP